MINYIYKYFYYKVIRPLMVLFIFIIFLNAKTTQKDQIAQKEQSSILLDNNNNNVWEDDYNKACGLYEEKKYEKALKILDDIIPHMMFAPKIIDAKLIQAYSNFYLDNLDIAICQLEELTALCKNTTHRENVEYILALAYEKNIHVMSRKSVEYRDEAETKLKTYLQKYPDSIHYPEIKDKLQAIHASKLEEELDIIKTYYLLEYYDAAISLTKKIVDKIDIEEYKIKADYLTLNILYKRALLKKELPKIAEALAFCLNFISDYSTTKYIKHAKKMYAKLNYLIK